MDALRGSAARLVFSLTIVYAIWNENYATVPFLLLFVWGLPAYTGACLLAKHILLVSARRQRSRNAPRYFRASRASSTSQGVCYTDALEQPPLETLFFQALLYPCSHCGRPETALYGCSPGFFPEFWYGWHRQSSR